MAPASDAALYYRLKSVVSMLGLILEDTDRIGDAYNLRTELGVANQRTSHGQCEGD